MGGDQETRAGHAQLRPRRYGHYGCQGARRHAPAKSLSIPSDSDAGLQICAVRRLLQFTFKLSVEVLLTPLAVAVSVRL